jgi:predicted dehydrogenase
VAWLADVNAPVGSRLSRACGVRFQRISNDVVDLPDADLVVLAIPNGVRGPYYEYLDTRTESALYVEKPLARSVSEHRRIADPRLPSRVAVGLDRRSYAVTRAAGELFEHRPFGVPVSASFEFGGPGGLQTGSGYMAKPAIAGGGLLYQVGVHFLDAILFASQAIDVRIVSGHKIEASGLDIHVEAQLSVELSDRSHFPLNVLVTQLGPVSNQIEVVFERAVVTFSVMYGTNFLNVSPRDNTHVGWTLIPREGVGAMEMFASFALHWTMAIDALRTGRENYTSASHVLLTTKALELLYSLSSES